jgi:NADH-quinone oxidoreductase subunit M
MGFCMIGMAACTPAGINGALFQMWNHGVTTAMLFLLVGVLYDRAHHRNIDGFGGMWAPMPYYGGITALAFMAGLGLPGLAPFVSEFLCLVGAFQATHPGAELLGFIPGAHYYQVLTSVSVLGVILGAGYFLWSYQKVFLGPLNERYRHFHDMNGREWFTLAPLAAITIILGVFPKPILDLQRETVTWLVQNVVRMPWIP